MSAGFGILLYVLTVWTAQCITDGKGGIPEDEAEDEKIN